jgi:hypothetical protein
MRADESAIVHDHSGPIVWLKLELSNHPRDAADVQDE